MLTCVRCHGKRGKGNGAEAEKVHFLGEAPHRTCPDSYKRCNRAGWSFGRFVLWIGPLWPTGRCGWCSWELSLFYWEHQQNANAEKLAGGLCWGQSQENTSAPELSAAGQASRIVAEGQAAPAALRCFVPWAITWQRPVSRSWGQPVLHGPSLGQGEGWGEAACEGRDPAAGTEIPLERSRCIFLNMSQKPGWQRADAEPQQQTLNPCANLPGEVEKQTRRSPVRAVGLELPLNSSFNWSWSWICNQMLFISCCLLWSDSIFFH